MKKTSFPVIGLLFMLSGCATPPADTVFQISTIDALLAGVYEGDLTCRRLLKHGDLGVGTFNELDGELAILDGKVYQIKSDGKVYQPDLSVTTPFASVSSFHPDIQFSIDSLSDFLKVQELIDGHASNLNLIYSIKITGQFRFMHTRSVPRQSKPFPPLAEVTAHQPEFRMEDCAGTILGFRLPGYIKGINIPGYHLHFLTDDRSFGGHILNFEMTRGTCDIDILHQLVVALPEGDKAFAETDLNKDRSVELKKVESIAPASR